MSLDPDGRDHAPHGAEHVARWWLAPGTLRAILVALFVVQWIVIAHFAVDVPHFDEWEYFRPGNHLFSLEWLFAQHNEHRIVPTKLIGWANYALCGWNFAYQTILDFGIYGALLAVVYAALVRLGFAERVFAPFFVFLLSDIAWENHAWSFQSQFHLFLLFHFAASWTVARAGQDVRRWLVAAAFSTLAMWSFSSGIVVSVLLAACCAIRALAVPREARRPLAGPLAYVVVVVVSLAMWVPGYRHPEQHPPLAFPWTFAFWKHAGTQSALAFGWSGSGDAKWIVSLLVIVTVIALPSSRRLLDPRRWSPPDTFLAVATASILACIGVVALGRGSFGALQARSSRYAEIAGLLLPFLALLVARAGAGRRVGLALAGLWLFAAVGFADDWDFAGCYRRVAERRAETLRCVLETRDESCPCSYDRPLRAMADHARELGIHFTRGRTP